MKRRSKHTYRFVLYGRVNSGKTCLLAALAMAREPHPAGFACDWRATPTDVPRPPGDEQVWVADDPAVTLYRGREWLLEAIEALESGNRPPGNSNQAAPFRFRFDFKDGNGRTIPVELTDYSGELIDPGVSDDELAHRVRQHALETDALFVLADAPRRGDAPEDQAKEFHRLRTAFGLLHEEMGSNRVAVPIAMLVNKWDRHMELEGCLPDAAQCELDAFLNDKRPEAAPFGSLRDDLRPPTADDFQAFAVSAFGKTTQDDTGHDRPARVCPLPAFGLEDPFVWAARRRDEIDLARLQSQEANLSRWMLWKPLLTRSRDIQRVACRLGERALEGSDTWKRATELRSGARRSFWERVATWIGLAACVALLLGYGINSLNMGARSAQHRTSIEDSAAYLARLEQATEWFRRYEYAPLTRVRNTRVLTRAEARGLREAGEHRIASLKDREWKNDQNASSLNHLDARLTAAKQVDELNALLAHERLPFPEIADPAVVARFANWKGRAEIERDHLLAELREKDFEAGYYQTMNARKVVDAAAILAKGGPGPEVMQRLQEDFQKRAVAILEERTKDAIRGRDWKEKGVLSQAMNDPVRKLLSRDDVGRIETCVDDLKRAEDRDLYSQFLRDRTEAAAEAYLRDAPLKRMAGRVEQYRKFLEESKGELKLTLKLVRMEWGPDGWSEEKNKIDVWAGEQHIIDASDVVSRKGDVTSNVGEGTIRTSLDGSLDLRIRAEVMSGTKRFIYANRDQGVGSNSVKVRDLLGGGVAFELTRFGNKAVLAIDMNSLPKAPTLPEWE